MNFPNLDIERACELWQQVDLCRVVLVSVGDEIAAVCATSTLRDLGKHYPGALTWVEQYQSQALKVIDAYQSGIKDRVDWGMFPPPGLELMVEPQRVLDYCVRYLETPVAKLQAIGPLMAQVVEAREAKEVALQALADAEQAEADALNKLGGIGFEEECLVLAASPEIDWDARLLPLAPDAASSEALLPEMGLPAEGIADEVDESVLGAPDEGSAGGAQVIPFRQRDGGQASEGPTVLVTVDEVNLNHLNLPPASMLDSKPRPYRVNVTYAGDPALQ